MSSSKRFDISHKEIDGTHVVNFKGHFDATAAPLAEIKIIEIIEKADKIVANFNELIYISSAGLRVILVAAKKSKKKKTKIIFCSIGENVKKILEMSNFLSFLETAESLEEALSKLKNQAG